VRDTEALSPAEKLKFFKRAQRAYGHTGLLLSGGAGLGYFHVGVLKALHEQRCLPSVICGASAGSLMAAYIGVRTEEEFVDLFQPEIHKIFTACEEPMWVKLKRYLKHGYLFDVKQWVAKLQVVTKGNTTFLEAYRKTGRVLNISITSVSKYVPAMVLNAFNTPHIVIWSAVCASSAFPNIIQPVELMEKDQQTKQLRPFHAHGRTWSDGTLKNDIPIGEIAKMHDCNFFVVSQVNPHVMPFMYRNRGSTGLPSPHGFGSRFRGGFFLAMIEKFLKLEMRKWLQLMSELDLLPTFFGQDFRYVFLQAMTGTVTIVPTATMKHYFHIIMDPTYDDMKDYIHRGQRAAWHALSRISNHHSFEVLLRDCRLSIERQVQPPKPDFNLTSSSLAESLNGDEFVQRGDDDDLLEEDGPPRCEGSDEKKSDVKIDNGTGDGQYDALDDEVNRWKRRFDATDGSKPSNKLERYWQKRRSV
jgi:predicted acylesterase/phospholipase RssA